MFRFRLAVVITVAFCFVLLLGIILYWGSNQVASYFQRSQIAYETFDQYERLSQEAYRHFKQRMDSLMTANPNAEISINSSRQRLYAAMEDLRNTVVKLPTTTAISVEDSHIKPSDLEGVAHFTAFLEAIEYRFNEIEQLRQQGKREKAMQMLSTLSEEEIDGKFQPMIDTAINIEREKASKAKQELEALVAKSHTIAILVSFAAALFSCISGVILLRGVQKPIEALIKGTDEIASGNLLYRISIDTYAEFAYLATNFNQMAQEIDTQQEKLREGRFLLEQKVAARTFELLELNEELKRMDCARQEFLADVSHELRTPITVIRGEAEVTLRGGERHAAEYREALQRIVELSIQLGKYVNDLLMLARTENTNLQFEWDNLDLVELLTSTLEDFQIMAKENSLRVSLEVPFLQLWVRADRHRLKQVLFILGDNACRYSDTGGQIKMQLSADEKSTHFSVSDQGIGIPNQDLERIFERKFRSKNALESRHDGTGLGLPMAKAIIKAHGGSIAVHSIENSGSTFTVSLPLITDIKEVANA